MKYLGFLIGCLFLSSPSWALIASSTYTVAGSTGADTVTTPGITTTGANFIVAVVTYYDGGTFSNFQDSKGNTWTKRTVYTDTNATAAHVVQYYVVNPTVGSGHTFTAWCTACAPGIAIHAFSGVNTSPFDVENGTGTTISTSRLQPGAVTPSQDNELIITGPLTNGGGAPAMTINAGFTTDPGISYTGNHFTTDIGYIINGAGTSGIAVNPDWTDGNGPDTRFVSNIATYKVAAAAGGGSKTMKMERLQE